jgi:hypothetical protein
MSPIKRKTVLLKLARTVATHMGTKYADVVQSCLKVEGNELEHVQFVKDILES